MINLDLYRYVVYSHITYAAFYCPIHLGLSLRFIGILSERANISQYVRTPSFDNKGRTFGNRAWYYHSTWITDRSLKIALNQALCADYPTFRTKSESPYRRNGSHKDPGIHVSLLSSCTYCAISQFKVTRYIYGLISVYL